MTAVGLITRSQMADFMASGAGANVSERFQHRWRRVDTIMARFGDGDPPVVELGFHTFAVVQNGQMDLETRSVLEGSERQTVRALPGAVSYIQAHVPIDQTLEGVSNVQQIYVDDSVFRETAASLVKGDPDKVELLGFQGVFEPQLRALAEAILLEARAPSVGSELQADLLAQQMALVILRRRLGDQARTPRRRRLSNSELARVIDFLEADLSEGCGIDTLAALIDMDVFTFTRAFKATTGQPPHKFLIERRLARVKDLLINSSDSLADISYHTGFSSQPHMTAAFSKHMKMPPGAYRKKFRT